MLKKFHAMIWTAVFTVLPLFAAPDVAFSADGKAVQRCNNKDIAYFQIPDKVTTIRYNAFYNCSSLTVTVPPSVTEIEPAALGGVRKVILQPGNPRYYQTDRGLLIDRDKKTLIHAPLSYTGICRVPDGIEVIGQRAFYNCAGIVSVTLPSSVRHIREGAFTNCSSLASVKLNTGLRSIESFAFGNCSRLRNIVIPATVRNIESAAFFQTGRVDLSPHNPNFKLTPERVLIDLRKQCLLYAPPDIKGKFVVPTGIKVIGHGAFYECAALKAIILPAGLRQIERAAFFESGLAKVDIPASVRKIGNGAFGNCDSLEKVSIRGAAEIETSAFGFCDGKEPKIMTVIRVSKRVKAKPDAFGQCEVKRVLD